MLQTLPHISVVLATYNGHRFLREQIDSLLQQTLPPVEIIVVDDASTDATQSLLQEYANKDPRFSIVVNEQTLGYVKNFEKGMLLAKGDLIALCDQDDVWLPHKLATLHNAIGNHLLVYSNSELIDQHGQLLHQKMSDIRNQIGYHSCLMYAIGAWAPGHAMLFRKTLVSYCQPFPTLVTHDFWLGFVATCYSPIKYLDEPLVYYRQHTQNAIGADTHAAKKTLRPSRKDTLLRTRNRMQLLYEKCPDTLQPEKSVFETLHKSYQSFSIRHNWIRMRTFFRYRHLILAYKKKSPFMKWLFCVKMFFKID